MKKISNIVAVIPAYNEETRIKKVIESVFLHIDTIIVVDDGSTDYTASIVRSTRAILIQHITNIGAGAALQTGLEYAKTLNPDIVVTFDADGQFEASEIPRIIKPLLNKKYDVVFGSRFMGKAIHMPLIKLFILKIGIIVTYIFSGIKLTDTHNGFRGFNKKTIDIINITQNGMAHASEIIDQIKQYNLRYIEVPVTVKYDSYSKRKGQRYSNALNIVFNLLFKKIQ